MTVTKRELRFKLTTDPHIWPLWVSYGVSIVKILKEIDRIIRMAP